LRPSRTTQSISASGSSPLRRVGRPASGSARNARRRCVNADTQPSTRSTPTRCCLAICSIGRPASRARLRYADSHHMDYQADKKAAEKKKNLKRTSPEITSYRPPKILPLSLRTI
jgi:hypothetical protein